MTFLSLIFKNIWRNKIRTLLTVLGVSIGIATIVVFGLATSGLKESITQMIKPGKIDFTVAKASAADLIVSFLSKEQIDQIKNVPGVKEVVPYVLTIISSGGNPYFVIGGLEVNKLELAGAEIIEGRAYDNADEVIIGKIAIKNKNLKIGDLIELNKKNYKIVGVFESGVTYQDSGVITTIQESQRIQGITDKVTMVMVKVADNYNVKEVARKVEETDKDFISIINLEDYNTVDQGAKAMDAVSWAISLLAIVIGGIGVMNTIIMSVFERTREIGVLRAIGWKRRQIITMILSESIIIGILAAVIGIIMGLALIWLVMQSEIGKSWLKINYDIIIFTRALIVSLLVVLGGSVYPSFKASKLKPTEALRYE